MHRKTSLHIGTALLALTLVGSGCARSAFQSGAQASSRMGGDGVCWNSNTVSRAEVDEAKPLYLEEMLTRIPGVRVQYIRNGGFSIQIRGSNTVLGSTEPLYVIDGVPLAGLRSGGVPVSPEDIACIEVLKDVGQTSMFGTRGSNGVVLITTRRGP